MSGQGLVRVSVRELYEIAKWAFVAAGASAGEAAAAARVVQLAEVNNGCGLDAALRELADHRFNSCAVKRQRGPVEVIADNQGRGLLMLGPLVAAVVAVRGQLGPPVLIRGLPWHPVMAAVLIEGLRSAPSAEIGLCAWEVASDGLLLHRVRAGDDPNVTRNSDLDNLVPCEWSGQTGPGVLVASAPVPEGEAAGATARLAAALRNGVEVNAAEWSRLTSSAQNYLVADSSTIS